MPDEPDGPGRLTWERWTTWIDAVKNPGEDPILRFRPPCVFIPLFALWTSSLLLILLPAQDSNTLSALPPLRKVISRLQIFYFVSGLWKWAQNRVGLALDFLC